MIRDELYLTNRINKLMANDIMRNGKIINKLKRKLRKIEQVDKK